MTTFTKMKLSNSINGRFSKIYATSTPGTTIIHTTGTSSTVWDEVWLYAYNVHTVTVALTLEWGGATAPDDTVKLSIPSQAGLTLVIPGLILSGTGSAASVIAGYASTASVIMVSGYVNRIA